MELESNLQVQTGLGDGSWYGAEGGGKVGSAWLEVPRPELSNHGKYYRFLLGFFLLCFKGGEIKS